jgi:hypothetical protein
MGIIQMVLAFLKVFFASRVALAAENLARWQQLSILPRSVKHIKLRKQDRILWVWSSVWLRSLVGRGQVKSWYLSFWRDYWRRFQGAGRACESDWLVCSSTSGTAAVLGCCDTGCERPCATAVAERSSLPLGFCAVGEASLYLQRFWRRGRREGQVAYRKLLPKWV